MLLQLPGLNWGGGGATRGQHSLTSYGINFIQKFKTFVVVVVLAVRVDLELSVCLGAVCLSGSYR